MFDALGARDAGLDPPEIALLETAYLLVLHRLGGDVGRADLARLNDLVRSAGLGEAEAVGSIVGTEGAPTIAARALRRYGWEPGGGT